MITENSTTTTKHTQAVTVSLEDLKSPTPIPDTTLLEAFGPSSLGILIVSGLPANFPALRSRVLTQISRLAHLPQTKLDGLVNEKAKYLVGWSHGKETLRAGAIDWLKGSYYVNTAFTANDKIVENMRRQWQGFDEYLAPNIWPGESEPQDGLEGFQRDVEELVSLIVDVARYVARSIDRFAERNVENWPVPGSSSTNTNTNNENQDQNQAEDQKGKTQQQQGYLEGVVSESRTSKARLLHYFPSESRAKSEVQSQSGSGPPQDATTPDNSNDNNKDIEDSWCTVHKDHSCLTGLTSAAFFDETSSSSSSTSTSTPTPPDPYTELPTSPSPTAGLYILDRAGSIHKVSIPRDSLAFQTGEALELVTKGKLKAVPHFVRGVDVEDPGVGGRSIARNTLAVFTQPNLFETVDLDRGIRFGEYARGVVDRNTTTG